MIVQLCLTFYFIHVLLCVYSEISYKVTSIVLSVSSTLLPRSLQCLSTLSQYLNQQLKESVTFMINALLA